MHSAKHRLVFPAQYYFFAPFCELLDSSARQVWRLASACCKICIKFRITHSNRWILLCSLFEKDSKLQMLPLSKTWECKTRIRLADRYLTWWLIQRVLYIMELMVASMCPGKCHFKFLDTQNPGNKVICWTHMIWWFRRSLSSLTFKKWWITWFILKVFITPAHAVLCATGDYTAHTVCGNVTCEVPVIHVASEQQRGEIS